MAITRETDIAVSVRGVGKRYDIARTKNAPTTTGEALVRMLTTRRKSAREEFWALNDVSFDVYSGDVVGLVGRNGAGKSTLLKVLSRITEPTTGEIVINGRVGSLL